MSKIQPVRGTYDLLPDNMARHIRVIDAARQASIAYGFQEMATPIFEFAEVFSRPLGETSDIVTKENYSFADRGGEMLTLRPENTAGVVRAMISGGLTQSLPLKYFYNGPMFRYERPQKGRMRQFHQVGVECLGQADAFADAEIIACGARFLKMLGVLELCSLNLNTLGDQESRLSYREDLVKYLRFFVGELSADSQKRLEVNPLRILDSKDEGDQEILKDAPLLQDYLNTTSRTHFEVLQEALNSVNISWKFNPLLVRGLDYYCHTAFEFVTSELGTQGTVLGGGRYDGLSEMLGSKRIPGVGWAAGVERLVMFSDDIFAKGPKVAVISADEASNGMSFQLAEALRDRGIDVDLPTEGSMRKKIKKADQAGVHYVLILGSDEREKQTVQLRDLADGRQREVPITNMEVTNLAEIITNDLSFC